MAAKILVSVLCAAALLCGAGCADTAGEAGETIHYGYSGARPAECAACVE